MAKQLWKPGNMLYPLPAVMVSVRDKQGKDNIITVAWAGTICTNPPMVSISVRPERYSYHMLEESREFVINLTTEKLCYATDYCGVRSGRDVDKFREMKLTKIEADEINAPMIGESPVNIECKVKKIEKLGSHHMFVADVVAVHADESCMDERGRFDLNRAKPMVYSHGEYYGLADRIGTFGYSVRKKKKNQMNKSRNIRNNKTEKK
jgi:flavin reductase (DIM6/NTAB) family NADH-FMN oxidoreductase RutF